VNHVQFLWRKFLIFIRESYPHFALCLGCALLARSEFSPRFHFTAAESEAFASYALDFFDQVIVAQLRQSVFFLPLFSFYVVLMAIGTWIDANFIFREAWHCSVLRVFLSALSSGLHFASCLQSPPPASVSSEPVSLTCEQATSGRLLVSAPWLHLPEQVTHLCFSPVSHSREGRLGFFLSCASAHQSIFSLFRWLDSIFSTPDLACRFCVCQSLTSGSSLPPELQLPVTFGAQCGGGDSVIAQVLQFSTVHLLWFSWFGEGSCK
jgi:hypothetical protein